MKEELELCRQEYFKQKKLEKLVISRQLFRPNVKIWQIVLSCAILPFLIFAAIYFPVTAELHVALKIVLPIVSVVVILESYFRFCLILLIRYYQKVAKEETRRRCKCIPSCSDYSILTLKKIFPIALAIAKIRKRLFVTCNGEEYKIDFPTKKMGEKFERSL